MVTNSDGDTRTNLASGSFHCWLYPRCVYACMHLHEDICNPLKKTICLKMETTNKPQPIFLQESDLHTADLGEGGQRRKLWVVPTSATPYSRSSRGYSASCWEQLLECSRFSATVSDGLKIAAAWICFTSIPIRTCLRRAKRGWVGGGNQSQDLFFLTPLLFSPPF